MCTQKFQRRLTLLCLISISGVKHLPVLLAKNSATTRNFLHVFGRAPSDLQLCFVQLKTLAPTARYSTFKYPVTLKPRLGSLKVIAIIILNPAPTTSYYCSIVSIILSRTVSEISAISIGNRQIFPTPLH